MVTFNVLKLIKWGDLLFSFFFLNFATDFASLVV